MSIYSNQKVRLLKEFGFIKLWRKDFKKQDSRHYILYLPDSEKLKHISRKEFITIHDHDTDWGIEREGRC